MQWNVTHWLWVFHSVQIKLDSKLAFPCHLLYSQPYSSFSLSPLPLFLDRDFYASISNELTFFYDFNLHVFWQFVHFSRSCYTCIANGTFWWDLFSSFIPPFYHYGILRYITLYDLPSLRFVCLLACFKHFFNNPIPEGWTIFKMFILFTAPIFSIIHSFTHSIHPFLIDPQIVSPWTFLRFPPDFFLGNLDKQVTCNNRRGSKIN